MSNIQYYHNMQARYTIAMEVPTKEALTALMQPGTSKKLAIKIGRADCSKQDQYTRKVGASVAASRLQADIFELIAVNYTNDVVYMYLTNPFLEEDMRTVVLRINPVAVKPHFIDYQ